ncbi:hypothetical protein WN55_11154 [Dufourea novaeangliae]|uniref:Uncharacterized protein n=1 Tax=Dufourea novaeangliae TaxID=178035 RepID=A0A154PC63_DUFNO|nr:hypothetical protein WN55_11154 [Dufourea novaeangliae]
MWIVCVFSPRTHAKPNRGPLIERVRKSTDKMDEMIYLPTGTQIIAVLGK